MKKRNFKRAIALFWTLLLLLTMVPAFAAADSTAKAGKTVRVGYVEAMAYEEEHADGYKTGSGYEYLQQISYITGWKYEYVHGSFQECYDMLVKGEIDLFGDVTYTPEREELFQFSRYPQGQEVYCMYTTQANENLTLGDLSDLDGRRIGVTANSFQRDMLADWLVEKKVDAQIVEFSGYSALMEALDSGDVDTIVTPDLSIDYGYVSLLEIGSSDYYFAVSNQRPDLLKELNAAMREIQQNEFDYNGATIRKYHSQTDSALKLSEAETLWLENRDRTVKLGLLDHNLPYSAKNADGSLGGILSVLVNAMEKKLDVTVDVCFYSGQEELMAAMRQGEVDAVGPVYGDFYLAEQEDYVMTNELITTTPVMLYKKGGIDTDNGVVAVANETLFTEKALAVLLPDATPYLCQTLEECMEAVVSGKADGLLVSSVRLNTLRQYPAMEKLQFADLPLEAEVCLATSRENRMAASVLNKGIALSAASLNGSVLAESSYVDRPVTLRAFVRQNAALVLIVSSAVILALSIMAIQLYRNGKKLQVALGRAEDASMAKTTFLSNMSHDIRTPMNAIIGLTHLAQREDKISVIQSYLDKIASSSDFLMGLINDVLDMSKIENGNLTLNPEPMTKKAFASSIDTVVRPLMESRKVNFTCDLEEGPACVLADKLRLNQIFLNLLSNAAKFTPEGGNVELSLKRLPSEEGTAKLRFTVRDTGVGMSEEFLKHLYEPFSQERSRLSGNTRGTGLGLPIVKSLVDAMGGTIDVKSKLGEGTEFTVILTVPLAESTETELDQPRPASSLMGAKILLVEDNEINAYVAKLILEEAGCVVTVAENGQIAIDKFLDAEKSWFDAILMDVRMPVMDGITATKAIRALDRPDALTIPIIAMTADAFAEEKKKTIASGMNAHLSKPIDPTVLYAVLAEYIR